MRNISIYTLRITYQTLRFLSFLEQDRDRREHQRGADDPQPFLQRQAGDPDIGDVVWVVVPGAKRDDPGVPGPAAGQRAGQRPGERAALPPQLAPRHGDEHQQRHADEQREPDDVRELTEHTMMIYPQITPYRRPRAEAVPLTRRMPAVSAARLGRYILPRLKAGALRFRRSARHRR